MPVCSPLERNVVVARTAEGGHRIGLQLAAARLEAAAALAASTVAIPGRAQELDGVGDDLDRLALGAVLRLPLAPLKAAVDRDAAALGQVVRAVLALRAPHLDIEVVGLLDPLTAGAVLEPPVDGDPQLADRRAARQAGQLRIAGQVAGDDDSVDVGHWWVSPPASLIERVFAMVEAGADSADRVLGGRRNGRMGRLLRLGGGAAGHAVDGHEAHDSVGDGEHALGLCERFGGRLEGDHEVERLGLVADLVGQATLAPRLDLPPGALALLDDVLDAVDDLAVSLLGDFRLDQQHDFVGFDPDHLLRSDGGPGVPGAAIRISGGAVPWQEAVRLCDE